MVKPHLNRLTAILATLILAVSAPVSAQTPEGWITPDGLANMTVLDANQQGVPLGQYRGQPILLHLWASWCAPCVKEIPSLSRLQNDYAPRGLVLIPLSQDFGPDKVKRFFRRNGIDNLPILLDPNSKIFQSLKTRGLPISILIDRNGREVRRFAGNTNWDAANIRAEIDALLR
jgi:thiol-disulfide isomerase/thioredoxin